MDLWEQRIRSLNWFATDMKEEASLFEEAFSLIANVADRLNQPTHAEFGSVCALTIVKSRDYGLGCLSLTLDGNAHAAGALLRPLVEGIELLKYFRLDATRVEEALEDKLPSAGKRAQLIDGEFKFLRDHLNEHASHFSYSHHAIRHLVNRSNGEVKIDLGAALRTDFDVLKYNMYPLFSMLIFLSSEAVGCLHVAGHEDAKSLALNIGQLKKRGQVLLKG